MPKKRLKSSGNFEKSGILNSNYIKILDRQRNKISNNQLYINTTPINKKEYLGNDYFDDSNTYTFLERENTNSVLGVSVVPLASNPDNFYITSDPFLLSENIVSEENELKINKNMLTFNSNIIDSPNFIKLKDFDQNSVDRANIFTEINKNSKEEIYQPFYDEDIEKKFSESFLYTTLTDVNNNQYYLGNEKSIEIEIDFSNSEDCHLVNTLFVNRQNNNMSTDIDSINDTRTFTNQYNFNTKNKYSITSSLLTNSYWNNTQKRWEYNLNRNPLISGSGLIHANASSYANSIIPNNITVDINNDSNISNLYKFVDDFISIIPITHGPYYDRLNDIELKKYNYSYNKLTYTYGFPNTDIWNPNLDQLIKLSDYITNYFLLEKISFEGNISINSEIPKKKGNIEITSDSTSFNEEKLITINESNYNIVGLNFYLLNSKRNNMKTNSKYFKTLSGFRVKRNNDNASIKDYNEDSEGLIDFSCSDLKKKHDIDKLSGNFYYEDDYLTSIESNKITLEYETIANSVSTNLFIQSPNGSIQSLKGFNNFYYLTPVDKSLVYNNQEAYLCQTSILENESDFYNFDINNNDSIQHLEIYNKFSKADSDEYHFKNEIITESSLFYIKQRDNNHNLFLNKYDNFSMISTSTQNDYDNDSSISLNKSKFITSNICKNTESDFYNNESNFSFLSNYYNDKVVVTNQINAEVSITFNLSSIRSYLLDNNISTITTLRNHNSRTFIGQTEQAFQSFVNNSTDPDFTFFNMDEYPINFRFVYNSFTDAENNQINAVDFSEIVSYDNNLNINNINIAVLENPNVIEFFLTLNNSYLLNYPAESILRNKTFYQFGNVEFASSDFNNDFLYDKKDIKVQSKILQNLIIFSIFLSKGKSNNTGEIKELVDNIINVDNDIYTTSKIILTQSYTSNQSNNQIISYNDNFKNILTMLFDGDSTFTTITEYISPVFKTKYFVDEMSFLEGKSKTDDSLKKLGMTVEQEQKTIVSKSGKKLSGKSVNKSNFQYLLSPDDTVLFGVSSFSNFNTIASHIRLHDKLKITLFGREVKEKKKNESSQCNSINKVFVGNNSENVNIDDSIKTLYSNSYLETNDQKNYQINDTLFPSINDIYKYTLNKGSQRYSLDSYDIYYNRKNNLNKNKKGIKLILKDTSISDIVGYDSTNAAKFNDIVTDWHQKFYFNFDVESFKDKRFNLQNSATNSNENITLYYDIDSYAVNNNYFYNNFTITNYSDDISSGTPFVYSLNDITGNCEKSDIVVVSTENDNYKEIRDISTLGLNYNIFDKNNDYYKDMLDSKFITEDSLFKFDIDVDFDFINSNENIYSLQYLKIPSDFYYLESMNYISTDSVVKGAINSWCLTVELLANNTNNNAIEYFLSEYDFINKKFDYHETYLDATLLPFTNNIKRREYIFNKNKYIHFGEDNYQTSSNHYNNNNTGPRNYITILDYEDQGTEVKVLKRIFLVIPFRNKEVYQIANFLFPDTFLNKLLFSDLAGNAINNNYYYKKYKNIEGGPLFDTDVFDFLDNQSVSIARSEDRIKFNIFEEEGLFNNTSVLHANDFMPDSGPDAFWGKIIPYTSSYMIENFQNYVGVINQNIFKINILKPKLISPKINNLENVIFDEYTSNNTTQIVYDDFIKSNILTLLDKKYFDDNDYENKKLLSYSNTQTLDKSIKNNIFIYKSNLYKKYSNYFKKLNIELIYTVKNNQYNFNYNSGARNSRIDDYINILGIKYNNNIFDRNYLRENQTILGLTENDVLRVYENSYVDIYYDNNLNNNEIYNNYFFEIEMKYDVSTYDDDENSLTIKVSPLFRKINAKYVNDELTIINAGTPIASLNSEEFYAKLFLFGYRKSRNYKYPVDKFDGYRFGIEYPNTVKKTYLFNNKSFGQFKDVKYDTQNYSLCYIENGKIVQQFCVEKNYVNEYYQTIQENNISGRAVFIGSNADKYCRVYYPYLESNTKLESDNGYDASLAYYYEPSVG